MDLTSQRVLFGAAGASGGIQSYAIRLQNNGSNNYSEYFKVAYDPTTERTACVTGNSGEQRLTIKVWDKDWTLLLGTNYITTYADFPGVVPTSCTFDASGNLLITGITASATHNAWILKLDSNYTFIALKGNFSTPQHTFTYAIDQDSTGIYLGGSYTSTGRLYLTKVNTSLTSTLWNSELVDTTNAAIGYRPRKIVVTPSFVYAFGAHQLQSSNQASGLSKWNKSTGSGVWYRYTSGNVGGGFYGGCVDSTDHSYAVWNSNYTPRLIKCNPSGATVWTAFANEQYCTFEDVTVDPLGNLYVIGLKDAAGGGQKQLWLTAFNSNGNVMWQRRFGYYNLANKSYSTYAHRLSIRFLDSGAIRIHADSSDTIHGLPQHIAIEVDPENPPIGNFDDPYVYTSGVRFQWRIEDPAVSMGRTTTQESYVHPIEMKAASFTAPTTPPYSHTSDHTSLTLGLTPFN